MQMPTGHLLAAGLTAATQYNLPPANWQSNPSSSVSAKPMKMKGITLEKSRKPHPPHRLCRCGWGKYIAGNRIPHRQRMQLHPTGVVFLFIGYGIRTNLNADAHWASACCRLGGGNTIDRRQIGNRIPSRHYTFRPFCDMLTKRRYSNEQYIFRFFFSSYWSEMQ